uniref:Lectin, mannose-binding, 1 n=1 Tax=Cyclopterus lumpus TaxID=8103 RepID=A0A8C2Z2Y2_CYCLU
MAVSTARRPAAIGRVLIITFLTAIIFRCGVADVAPGASTSEELPHRRFEYKYSFKGPHLSQTDGGIPFWIHTGNAIPSADQVRITPSLRSQKGSVWTKNKVNFAHWEAEVTFRVSGRGRMGADGLAVWFTSEQGLDGPVYGAADQWNGVGIFFDSFDNDGKKNNPSIVVVGNNGKLVYDHQNDGTTQALGTCLRDFRNKPYPIRAKISYYKRTLTVMINNGFTPDRDDYEFCTKVDNMVLPGDGFFGISAATGGLADDHDVLSFLLFTLTEPGQQPPPPESEIPKEEKDKYQEEFQNFQQELDKKKEEFQKEHPGVQGEQIDDMYENVNDREIRQVFEGQNQIHLEIKQLHRQLAMILDEQRRYVSVITTEVTKKGPNAESGQVRGGVNANRYNMQHTVNTICNNGASGQFGGYFSFSHALVIFILHSFSRQQLKTVESILSEKAVKCPELPAMPTCLSTLHFVIFIIVQSVLFFCYIMYK